jgi:hypothetical protein
MKVKINEVNNAFIFQQWNDALQIVYSRIKCGWISSPDATYNANNRINQLTYAKKIGFNIPATIITNDPNRARNFYHEYNGNIILKVLHHHDIEIQNKVYCIYTHVVNDNDLLKFNDLVHAPCVLQERIRKHAELRVTVVRDRAFGVDIKFESVTAGWDDIHRCPLPQLPKRPIQLEQEVELRCINLIKSLGLKYGAIDLVIDENDRLNFLEVNPTGDWVWIERETKLPITEAIVDLIENTLDHPTLIP